MRKFILELKIDERIIEAGTTPVGLLQDLTDENDLRGKDVLTRWDDQSGEVSKPGAPISLSEEIRFFHDGENGGNRPILYTWKLKEVK